MQKYDFTAPASGASQVVNAPGRYLKYTVGNAGGNDAGLIVTPGGKPGSKILLYPGQAITLSAEAAVPNSWTIANALSQGVISGTVVVGEGRLDDNTLQGTVQVVDGGKARTLANRAFSGNASVGQVAGQFGRIQLWNPATNTNRLVVESVDFEAAATGYTGALYINNTVLATLEEMGQSKLSGGAASLAGIFIDNTATPPVFPLMMQFAVQANSMQFKKFNEPIIILPGYGLEVYLTTVNVQVLANFEWYEEANV